MTILETVTSWGKVSATRSRTIERLLGVAAAIHQQIPRLQGTTTAQVLASQVAELRDVIDALRRAEVKL